MTKGGRGYWADHDYHRRQVQGLEGFSGWNRIITLVKSAKDERDANLIRALFLTGGRAGEVGRSKFAGLQRKNIVVKRSENVIVFSQMRVLKKYKKNGWRVGDNGKKLWLTERVPFSRTFPSPLGEPITEDFVMFLDRFEPEDFLFPIGPTRIYQIVEAIDSSIWVHWFRSQRASQLAVEYGFALHDIVEYFRWQDVETAMRYAKLNYKDLAKKFPKQEETVRAW